MTNLSFENLKKRESDHMNILWDFDGTLFDTYPVFTDMLYEELGGAATKQEILAHLKISFTHMFEHYGLSKRQLYEKFQENRIHPSQTPPFPGVEDVLRFAEINVIMTHKPREEVLEILNYYNWTHYFRDLVAGDDGYPRKPDPASYIYLHNKYNLNLAIGDREIDILPAKSIGIRTCLFQNETPGADMYITRYEDFFEQLSKTSK